MVTETTVESRHLGAQTKDFLRWSKNAGYLLTQLLDVPLARGTILTKRWFKENSTLTGDISLLHTKDAHHFPAVRIAHNDTLTYIQSFPMTSGDITHRRAHLIQIARNGLSASIAPTRSRQNLWDGVSLRFGTTVRYPQSIHSTGQATIEISKTGVASTQQFVWEQKPFLEFIKVTLDQLFTGQNATKMKQAKQMATWRRERND